MRLKEAAKLLEIWQFAFDQGANVVLMRHGPKAGSNNSGLSPEGQRLIIQYGKILKPIWARHLGKLTLACTDKTRTAQTLSLLLPHVQEKDYLRLPELTSPRISDSTQRQVNDRHREVGHWRGYFLNHTYYFLEELGGRFGAREENPRTNIALKMTQGIKKLFALNQAAIYCGHSPAIEAASEKLLDMGLAELGGFLNPLDSLHLRRKNDEIELVVRVNPLIGYVDLESETYYRE